MKRRSDRGGAFEAQAAVEGQPGSKSPQIVDMTPERAIAELRVMELKEWNLSGRKKLTIYSEIALVIKRLQKENKEMEERIDEAEQSAMERDLQD